VAGAAHAMMGGALVPDNLHGKVLPEAIACATQLDGLVVIEVNGKLATCNVYVFV
jgi:hypothetical protein